MLVSCAVHPLHLTIARVRVEGRIIYRKLKYQPIVDDVELTVIYTGGP